VINREQVRNAIAAIDLLPSDALAEFDALHEAVFIAYQGTITCYQAGLPIKHNWSSLIADQMRQLGVSASLAFVLAMIRDRLPKN
jgi:hypothetical protein